MRSLGDENTCSDRSEKVYYGDDTESVWVMETTL